MDTDCIFCKIVAGAIPSTRVYENEDVLAFMDIGPVVKGHTLVIPKAHFDPLTATPPEIVHKVMDVVQMIARRQIDGLGAEGVNIHQANGCPAGQVVPHLHIHVIPRYANDGHHWNWKAQSYADAAEMAAYAERMRGGGSRQ
jgi:histidine triad (HIT) family protein